eukprot:CAMPEP_0202389400 /NCGR_PEP_ID=MMETSP1127-20130417/82748_1 /ASSEMBLY_ACC=CAM_ASM_000462 /TAXON_ID=3047 /ORGANISM="Dunaliella tertiolecta, Strain CCMP1320" /LENGTH=60 /DNA_ID=CAMNT_0048991131 /DNA_START=39 /DNA_END=218 /DNA_ORIENTATION=+
MTIQCSDFVQYGKTGLCEIGKWNPSWVSHGKMRLPGVTGTFDVPCHHLLGPAIECAIPRA